MTVDTKARKPRKVPTAELPILTFSPDQPGQPHLAFIEGLPAYCRGATSEEAAAKMGQFRKDEMARLARDKENRLAASERMSKRKETHQ